MASRLNLSQGESPAFNHVLRAERLDGFGSITKEGSYLCSGLSTRNLNFTCARYAARAQDQDAAVDTPEDVQSTSEAATAPHTSDENPSYLSRGCFDRGTDTSGSQDDSSDLQPAPLTVTPNE